MADQQIAAGKFDRARQTLAPLERIRDPRLGLVLARMDLEEGRYASALARLDAIEPGFATSTSAHASPADREDSPAATYHRLRGVALEGLGSWSGAAAEYQAAYRVDPTAELLVAAVENLILDEQVEVAAALLERERKNFPGQPGLSLLAAELHGRRGNWELAIRELETAQLVQPESDQIRRRLADAYLAAGWYQQAAPLWRQVIENSRGEHERFTARRRLATCLLLAGQFDQARELYDALLRSRTDDAVASLGYAVANLAAGQFPEALQATLGLLDRHEDNPDARMIAGICYYRLNQPERAVQMLSGLELRDRASRLEPAPSTD